MVIERCGNTTQLLKDVAEKLRFVGEFNAKKTIDLNEMDSLRTSYAKRGNEIEITPVTKLFAIVDKFLRSMGCKPADRTITEEEYDFSYTNGLVKYTYVNDLTMAITSQKELDAETLFYVIMQFPEKTSAYKVIEIQTDWIPTYCLSTENALQAAIDDDIFSHLHDIISSTVTNFLQPVVESKFRKREYSRHGTEPFFLSQKKKKRKRKDSSETSDDDIDDSATLLSSNSIYGNLFKIFEDIGGKKPNASSRLFGIIMSYMKCNCRVSFTPSNPKSVWLTNVDYNANVETFSISKADRENKKGHKVSFRMNMVILTDDIDFFVIFRASESGGFTCIQKIIKDLVPTFSVHDIRYDLDRCLEIDHWLSDINKKFFNKVINDIHPPSRESLASSNESGSSSNRDSPAVSRA